MTEKSSSKTLYATSYFFDWENFRSNGIAELYLDTYYKSSQTEPERSKEPIAKGITAFFCAYNHCDLEPVISFIDRPNIEYDIEKYYEYYEEILLSCSRRENNKRSPIRRIKERDLIHIALEKELEYQHEGIIFTKKLSSVKGQSQNLLIEYVQDFPEWLALKHGIDQKNLERTTLASDNTSTTINDRNRIVEEHLIALRGVNKHGEQILKTSEYDNLLIWTKKMVNELIVPEECQPIFHISIKKEFLRKTYHMIHSQIYGSSKRKICYLEFLHTVFPGTFPSDSSGQKNLADTFSTYNFGTQQYMKDFNELLNINNIKK